MKKAQSSGNRKLKPTIGPPESEVDLAKKRPAAKKPAVKTNISTLHIDKMDCAVGHSVEEDKEGNQKVASDFTFFADKEQLVEIEDLRTKTSRDASLRLTYDKDISTKVGSGPYSGRGLFASTRRRDKFSITFRSTEPGSDVRSDKYPITINEIVLTMATELQLEEKGRTLQGLIVIAGETGCGKSQIAQEIIRSYLRRLATPKGGSRKRPSRRPHLVTLEDPIENLQMLGKMDTGNGTPISHGTYMFSSGFIDYTPRELRVDVKNLKRGLSDAKRMKPAVVYIGETRNKKDWREVMDFAGSGHLVVTTTHAGSLTETIQRIFRALKARTPAERGEYAKSIHPAIHLKAYTFAKIGIDRSIIVPTMWNGTDKARANMVADGLASILPNAGTGAGCIGRHGMANKLRTTLAGTPMKELSRPLESEEWKELETLAAKDDLTAS